MIDTDILISGGGIAGLVCAAGLAQKGLRVTLVDPAPPVQSAGEDGSDLRSTAFLQPARALFETLGLWDVLAEHATPLRALQVIDTAGWPPVERDRRIFEPAELAEEVFGWNLANWRTRTILSRVGHWGRRARIPSCTICRYLYENKAVRAKGACLCCPAHGSPWGCLN